MEETTHATAAQSEKDQADVDACVAEINAAFAQHLNPILEKHGCAQTFRVSGEGNYMQVQQIIVKQKK